MSLRVHSGKNQKGNTARGAAQFYAVVPPARPRTCAVADSHVHTGAWAPTRRRTVPGLRRTDVRWPLASIGAVQRLDCRAAVADSLRVVA